MLHPDIQNIYDTKCALAPPSPPRPPAPPPPPTGAFVPAAPSPPPPPPPPAPYFQQRDRDLESDYDPDCEIVSYATCKGIVSDYAAKHGTADVLRVSFAPCEGLDLDDGCFRVRLCAPLMANRLHCRSPLLPHAHRAAPTVAPTAGCSTTCCPTCSPSSTRPTRAGASSRSCPTARAPTGRGCTKPSLRRRPSRTPRTTTRTRRTRTASTSWAAAARASSTPSRARRRRS